MPVNKNLLARIRIIDRCLQKKMHMPSSSDHPDHVRCWTLQELKYAIEEDVGEISERTIKADLRLMRTSKELGYFAPIKNIRGVGYCYEDPNYKITDTPLSEANTQALEEVVKLIEQFKGFRFFEEADGIVYNIQKSINRSQFREIQLDTLPDYTGTGFIEPLRKAIRDGKVLKMTYQAFWEEAAAPRHIHPYVLKEFNNRWFVYAYTEEYARLTPERSEGIYALDRIISLEETKNKYKRPDKKKIETYFREIYGVTNYEDKEVEDIVVRVKKERANYLRTKPLHISQKIIKKKDDQYDWFSFRLKVNPELISMLLYYGRDAVVEKPASLKEEIRKILEDALGNYREG